jgi:hypothetical protein
MIKCCAGIALTAAESVYRVHLYAFRCQAIEKLIVATRESDMRIRLTRAENLLTDQRPVSRKLFWQIKT